MTDQNNPFAAPSANLQTPGSTNLKGIKSIPRFTTWAVVGLSVITLGFYFYYWLFSRCKIINSQLKEDQISSKLIQSLLAIFVVGMALSIIDASITGPDPYAEPSLFGMVSGVISLIGLVLYIMVAFGMRKRINILTNSHKGDRFWLGGVGSSLLTLFFSAYYFQYKVNQMHDQDNG